MANVRVYQFDYFDRLLKCYRRSADFATSDAIAELHGTPLAESERILDEDLLDERGFIMAKDLPPRSLMPPEPPPARRPGSPAPRPPHGR